MAAEPISVFSHKIDPRGVLKLLCRLSPSSAVSGPEDDWEAVALTVPQGDGRRPTGLTFRRPRDGPGWPPLLLGLRNHFAGFPDAPRKADALRLIGAFRSALAVEWAPDLVPDGDDRLPYLFAVAGRLDAALLTPSSLRDAEGRVLLGADGSSDPDAVLPRLPAEPSAPDPVRVARRALALAAVASRALLEQTDPEKVDGEASRRRVLDWAAAAGVGDELEPDERAVLERPVGALGRPEAVNATWRLEGLAVLAWALRRFGLPAYDGLVDPWPMLRSLGFLDADAARRLLAVPDVRPPDELLAVRLQLAALHGRLREFRLRPRPLNLRDFAPPAWSVPLDLTPFRLIDDDLALGDRPIARAAPDVLQSAFSAAHERRVAVAWLLGGAAAYSQADASA
jgi:hypothetical protein